MKPNIALILSAIENIKSANEQAMRSLDVLRATVPSLAESEPAAVVQPDELVGAAALARRLAVSKATVERLVEAETLREGVDMEWIRIGDRRRYHVAKCISRLATAGRTPTTAYARRPPEGEDDPIDISDVARRAGLRAVAR